MYNIYISERAETHWKEANVHVQFLEIQCFFLSVLSEKVGVKSIENAINR